MRVFLLILTAVICYVLGSLSGGMLLSSYVFRKHQQKYFSANIKAAEFYKDFGALGLALLVIFDILKAVVAVLIGGGLLGISGEALVGRLFAAFCLLLGNNFPVLFLFKGGRGLVCAATAAFFVDWRVGLCCCVAYIVVIIFTRYEALGGVIGAVLAPIFLWVFGSTGLQGVLALLCAILIIIRYAENLVRLVGGTEPRLDFGKASRPPEEEDDEDFE